MKLSDVYDTAFLGKLRPDRSEVLRFLHAVYVDPEGREDWATRQSVRLSECFDLAQRHGLVDADFIRRITSPDGTQFWGKVNEMTAARHFDRKGFSLTFNPPGRNSRVGEFMLELSRPTFVEVKTMLPRSADANQSRCLDLLCEEIRKIDSPIWVTIAIEATPKQEFRRKPFRDFIAREFPRALSAMSVPLTKTYTDDRSALRVAVTLSGSLTTGPMDASPLIGPLEIRNDDYVRATLQNAASQLPADKPCIPILFDEFTFPLSSASLLNALFGSRSVIVGGPGTEPIWTRLNNGFFREGQHTRVTAVGYFDTLGERNHPDPELQLYFHPNARFPLDPAELLGASSKHVVPVSHSTNGSKSWELTQPYDQFI